MFHVEYLLDDAHILKRKIHIEHGRIVWRCIKEVFDFAALKALIDFVKTIEAQNLQSVPVDIVLYGVRFADKLVIILLECVCYYLITVIKSSVRVSFSCKTTIWTAGINSSPLLILDDFKKEKQQKYIEKFKMDYYHFHFRRLITIEENADKSIASQVMQDSDSFFKMFMIPKDYRDQLTEVIVELIDNALEHTETDCLVDIDVAPNYKKILKDNGANRELSTDDFYGVNIVVVNFSRDIVGRKMQKKFFEGNISSKRYKEVLTAKENHAKQWTSDYGESEFFLIASFQRGISSRNDSDVTGGTGLTKLLQLIQKKSDAYNCYMHSEKKKLIFQHDYLNFTKESWIGFNIPNDFIHNIPDEECLQKSGFNIPGTAYNLDFVLSENNSNNVEE